MLVYNKKGIFRQCEFVKPYCQIVHNSLAQIVLFVLYVHFSF